MDRRLVLLDFDGTLTVGDTLLIFIRFYHGTFRFLLGFALLSPWLVAMKAKLLPNDRVKEMVLAWFFGKEPVDQFNRRCTEFTSAIVPGLIKSSAEFLLAAEAKRNSRIIVVSASAENWVKPWCDARGLECIATRLIVDNGMITGKIEGKNCYGAEKAVRIRSMLDLTNYPFISAYGDSRGDREMLHLATEPHYREL